MDKNKPKQDKVPVPGEGNMIYPEGQEEPEQGEVVEDKGLQEKDDEDMGE